MVALGLLALAPSVAGPAAAGGVSIPTTGLTQVQVTFHSSSKPAGDVFLRAASSLNEFAQNVRDDHLAVQKPPTSPSCSDPIRYTVEISYRTGPKVFLSADACDNAVSGNLTGNTKAFVHFLSTLVS